MAKASACATERYFGTKVQMASGANHLGGLLDDADPEEAPPRRLVEEVGLEDPGEDDGDASAHQPRGEQHVGCDGSADPRPVGDPDGEGERT